MADVIDVLFSDRGVVIAMIGLGTVLPIGFYAVAARSGRKGISALRWTVVSTLTVWFLYFASFSIAATQSWLSLLFLAVIGVPFAAIASASGRSVVDALRAGAVGGVTLCLLYFGTFAGTEALANNKREAVAIGMDRSTVDDLMWPLRPSVRLLTDECGTLDVAAQQFEHDEIIAYTLLGLHEAHVFFMNRKAVGHTDCCEH